jgi:protein SCO1/2
VSPHPQTAGASVPLRCTAMRRPAALSMPLTAVILAAAMLTMSACGDSQGSSSGAIAPVANTGSASELEGPLLPAGLHAREFALTDQQGRRVSLSQYRGRVVILTFLSASCGGPCVVLAEQIRAALEELPQPIPTLAVSTDPAADSRGRTDRFLKEVSLTGRMSYLTGTPAELEPIWRAYGIAAKNAPEVEINDADAVVLLIDRHGLERVSFPLEQLTPEVLTRDIRKLLSQPR